MAKTNDEPAIGIPYNATYQAAMPPQHHHHYYVGNNPYQAGMIPPNAVVGDPKGIPIQQTMYKDTPAPFDCVHCGSSGLTTVRSKPSLAAVVGCMMPMMLGVCFLCPSKDCLWHKYHYCPSCKEKVADFEKSDPCIVMDPLHWTEPSFALPA
ncbi:GSH-induced LITAF domain protein [Rhododendron vialii]|uniref:GSH-induced LITAF domain protein n=1 Tax=Rhododendron vialii TaxID=182163 RepID=UPI00265E971B|nr:GSH-induced LITAF domain protein [Rhododendron vialii]